MYTQFDFKEHGRLEFLPGKEASVRLCTGAYGHESEGQVSFLNSRCVGRSIRVRGVRIRAGAPLVQDRLGREQHNDKL